MSASFHTASGSGVVIERGHSHVYLPFADACALRDWLCRRYGEPRDTWIKRLFRRRRQVPLHY